MRLVLNRVVGFSWGLSATRLSYRVDISSDSQSLLSDTLSDIDLTLARKLVRRGPSHSKFLRCITVYLTVTAPRMFWQQFDQYRIGVTTLSQSTMHTLTKRTLTPEDFTPDTSPETIAIVNHFIKQKDLARAKANLPEGFLQTRAVHTNYQTLRTMYHQRREHRLKEWQYFCDFLETLPYADLIYSR